MKEWCTEHWFLTFLIICVVVDGFAKIVTAFAPHISVTYKSKDK